MVDLVKINQDAMKVVQLSELALGKANEWKLDVITYEIRDKDSKIVAEYEGRDKQAAAQADADKSCLLYTSPSPRDRTRSRMPSSA